MTGFSFELTGPSKRVLDRAQNMDRRVRRQIRHSMYQIGNDFVKTASKKILEKPKTGQTKIVRRGKTRRRFRHTASAPGEAPANLSGTLRRSLGFSVQGHSQVELGAGKDGSGVKYARALEFGFSPRNLKPRPYVVKSAEENFRNTGVHLENNIKKGLIK